MPDILIEPHGVRATAERGDALLERAQELNLPLPFGCLSARCGVCRVAVLAGALAPPSALETSVLEGFGCAGNVRLACQARIDGDVTLRPQNSPEQIRPEQNLPEQKTERS